MVRSRWRTGQIPWGYVPAYGTFIYKMDDNPHDGDIVPNLGTYNDTDANLYVVDNGSGPGGTEQLVANSTGLSYIGPDLYAAPFTLLIRLGDLATEMLTATVEPPGVLPNSLQAGGLAWPWELDMAAGNGVGVDAPFTIYQSYGTFTGSESVGVTSLDGNKIIMVTIDYTALTSRIVDATGAPFNYTSPNNAFVADFAVPINTYQFRLYKTYGFVNDAGYAAADWSGSFNGLGLWREYCNTDADFIRLRDEFLAA